MLAAWFSCASGACMASHTNSAQPDTTYPALSADQQGAARDATAGGLRVGWNSHLGTPASIRGQNLGRRGSYSGGKGLRVQGAGAFDHDAIAVMDNVSRLYRIRDAGQEFAARRTDTDALGFHHTRLRQHYQGLPVVGGDVIVHFDRHGEAYAVNGRYVPDLAVPSRPAITGEEAARRAAADLASLKQPAGVLTEGPTLCVFALNTMPVLAYELVLGRRNIQDSPARWRYWINAATGSVLLRYNDVPHVPPPTSAGSHAPITGNLLAGEGGETTVVTGWHENTGGYYLYNTNLSWHVYNYATNGYSDAGSYAYRPTSAWADTDRSEISLALCLTLTAQYYHNAHGRRSFDDQGTQARAYAHVGTAYANAFWDGTALYFGDGDGTTANPLGVLDICGHEFTHAVTEYSANLIYSDESGALNESFSDILGTCIEFFQQPDGRSFYPSRSPGTADWLVGEDSWLSSTALRDMRNPGNAATVGTSGRQPSRYKGTLWYGYVNGMEVHQNDGVQNFFFYLLSDGGSGNNDGVEYTVTGIGITNAAQVAYRALTVYCTPYTFYREAREAWISAAEDLNTNWVPSVRAAWNAVDVPTLVIAQTNWLVFRGPLGGPFGLTSHPYTLANNSGQEIAWSTTHTQAWLTAGSGVVASGGETALPVSVNSAAAALPRGIYTDTLVVSNLTEGSCQKRPVILQVGQRDYFTEEFPVDWEQDPLNPHINDLDYSMLTFVPDNSVAFEGSFYRASCDPATVFPSPTNGTILTFGPDAISNQYARIDLAGGAQVWLYGVAYSNFYIGSRGYITFGSGDYSWGESFAQHFDRPRISAMFDDMDCALGTRTWTQLVDRVVVTFQNVPEQNEPTMNNFQYELFFNGMIRLTYLETGSRDGLAGLSRGGGVPSDFTQSDLSAYGPYQGFPDTPDALLIQPLGGMPAQGCAGGPFVPDCIVYTLSNTSSVPVTWTVSQTQSWVRLSATGGTLAAKAVTNVTVALTEEASSLGVGNYAGMVTFSNTLSGTVRTRPVTLEVLAPSGRIGILDSLAPAADTNMPFGPVTIGLSRTEHLTLTNTDPANILVVRDIALGSGAYQENFNDGLAQGWLPDATDNWAVVGGAYYARAVHDRFMVSKYDRRTWSNVTLQVQWTYPADGPAILLLRTSRDFDEGVGSAYGFEINDGEFAIFKQVGGVYSWLHEPTTVLGLLAGANELVVQAQGSNLAFYVNGGLVWQGIDSTLTSGRIGLGARAESPLHPCKFDNVRVWEQPLAGLAPSAPAVSPFSLSGTPGLPLTLHPQQSATLEVTYAPGLEGHDEETLYIRSNAADTPETAVSLSGDCVADALHVQPDAPVQLSGHPGGPFAVSGGFVVSNAGPAAVTWVSSTAEAWLNLTPSSGDLEPGAVMPVTVSAGPAANGLGTGQYVSSVTFSNTTTTVTADRSVRLEVFTSPAITIAPPSLTVTNVAGGSTSRSLAIGNAAGADQDLSFQLLARETGRTNTGATVAATGGHDFTHLTPGAAYSPGRLLVRFAATQTAAARTDLLTRMGATIDRQYTRVAGLCRVNANLGSDPEQTLKTWNGLPGVLYAEPDYEVYASMIPNDERFGLMWGLNNTGQTGGTPGSDIHAPEAWDRQTGSRNVVTAIIDTGVDYAHEDLAANMWRNPGEIPNNGVDDDGNGYVDDVYGINAITRSGNPMDDNLHGTHCAGAVGAAGNNSLGVIGICWNARLMALKFLDASGTGYNSDAIACIEYAAQNGAKVLSCSWGSFEYQQALKDAIDAAGTEGVIVCAAAGNLGFDLDNEAPNYPAAYDSPNLIAVMATDKDDRQASFSDYGQQSVDLGAPGELMLNCVPGNLYDYLSGTSMATPLVAGACALVWSQNSLLSAAAVKEAILGSVDVPPDPLICVSGGRLNVARALEQAGSFWLSATPNATTNLPPGAITNVTVGFRAGLLPAGSYTGELAVVSNDRFSPQTNVTCVMVVTMDDLSLSPSAGLSSSGPRSGPFTPDSRVYTITNRGLAAIHWTAACTQSWATVEPADGLLEPGAAGTVTARLTQAANTLPAGSHRQTATFVNQDSGAQCVREISVTVAATSSADNLVISPLEGLSAQGPVGGPFTPLNAAYRMANASPSNLVWTVRVTTNWLSLTATNGTLDAGGTTNVSVWINALANSLSVGAYTGRVEFCDTSSGVTQSVSFTLAAKAYPTAPFRPNIPDGAQGVALSTNLSWNDTGATSLVGQATASALNVLICHSAQVQVDDIRAKLLAAGQFHSVTNLNPATTTPTLTQLLAFDAVLLSAESGYSDTSAWGNVMADYVDAGGGVVCMVMQCAGTTAYMGGRWLTQGYSTFPHGPCVWTEATLGTVFQPQHPIMWGVSSFDSGTGSFRPATNAISPGSVRVADWSDGRTLVVTRNIGNRPRADLGFYPPSSDQAPPWWKATTDGGRLMANALNYVAEATYGYGCAFDIYFGTTQPPTNCVVRGTKKTRFDPGPLAPATVYYWQVIATNEAGTTTGPVWSFTTTANTPREWLARYGLTNESWSVEEMLDRDGDGLKAWQEYITGTDPTNPLLFFHVLDISATGGVPTIRFYGTTNSGLATPFGMRRQTNLLDVGVIVDSSIPRNPTGTNVWTDVSPPGTGPAFYRPEARGP